VTTISNYPRAIDLTQPASRATGATMPPAIPGAPPPQPGTFNQNITPANAAWTQQLEIWVTPWGFLKGAAANNASSRSQRVGGKTYNVVSWSPAQKSPSGQPHQPAATSTAEQVRRVETWVSTRRRRLRRNDTAPSDFSGLKCRRIVQKRAGHQTFGDNRRRCNPANLTQLMTPRRRRAAHRRRRCGRGGAPGAPPRPRVQSKKMAEGVYRITGGYVALAVEFRTTSSSSKAGESRRAAWRVIAKPARHRQPIRFVVARAHRSASGRRCRRASRSSRTQTTRASSKTLRGRTP
jgi:hypothetical protein